MKEQEKQLLLRDLCAGVCANLPNHHLVEHVYTVESINLRNGWTEGMPHTAFRKRIYSAEVEDIQPYLRPMSGMTEEENGKQCSAIIDWFNAHHFDYLLDRKRSYNSSNRRE